MAEDRTQPHPPAPSEQPPSPPVEPSHTSTREHVQEGEVRKGTFVVPDASLPDGFVLPSAAPVAENPAVQVEPPATPTSQAGDGKE